MDKFEERKKSSFLKAFGLLLLLLLLFGVLGSPTEGKDQISFAQGVSYPKDTDPFPTPPPKSGGGGGGTSTPPVRPIDPGLSLECTNPELSVALIMDRSNSVSSESGPDTPDQFKDAARGLLDQLYTNLNANRMDVFVYGMATQSVLQNRKETDTGELITDYISPSNRSNIRNLAIEEMHFRDDDDPASRVGNYQTGDSFSAGLRGYDAGTSYSDYRPFGLTNWYDALVRVRLKSTELKARNIAGGGVDLVIVLTDGYPNVFNGSGYVDGKHTWGKRTFNDSAFSLERWNNEYATYTLVDNLREGKRYTLDAKQLSPAPPASVKGIVIRPVDNGWMDHTINTARKIFGSEHHLFANDFGLDLQAKITELVGAVVDESGCGDATENPSIQLISNPGSTELTIMEETSKTILYSAKNIGSTVLTDTNFCFGIFESDNPSNPCRGNRVSTLPLSSLGIGITSSPVPKEYSVPLGISGEMNHKVTAYGYYGSELIFDSKNVVITPERVALPS